MKTMLSAVLVAMGLTLGTSAFAETAPPAPQNFAPNVAVRANVERKDARQDLAKARLEQQRAEAKLAEAKRHEAAAMRDRARAQKEARHGDVARAAREQQMARRQMAQAEKDIEAARRDQRKAQELRIEGRQEGREARQGQRPYQR